MKLKFEFQNQEYQVEAEKIGTTTWIHFQGETFSIEAKPARRNVKLSDPGIATSPMPGKVTKIMMPLGSAVKLGQVVVVMEAMKMEYSLKSNTDGHLKEIYCELGDQVSLGQKLFEVVKAGPA